MNIKRTAVAVIVLLSVLSQLGAQELLQRAAPTLEITAEVFRPLHFKIEKGSPNWLVTDKVQAISQEWESNVSFVVKDDTFYVWAPVGTHYIRGEQFLINWTKQDIFRQKYEIKVVITGQNPGPNPDPKPEPPKPDPNPDPKPAPNNPFGTELKLKVLFVEEQSKRTEKEVNLFNSAELRDFLEENKAEWRILDKDTQFSTENQWKKAIDTAKGADFAIVVSNGKKWEVTNLPATVKETIELIRKFLE